MMKAKTITVQLDENQAAMLEALEKRYHGAANPTSIYKSAAKHGLMRLCAEFGIDPRQFGYDVLDLQVAGVEVQGDAILSVYPSTDKAGGLPFSVHNPRAGVRAVLENVPKSKGKK